jgi:hypothetical protein
MRCTKQRGRGNRAPTKETVNIIEYFGVGADPCVCPLKNVRSKFNGRTHGCAPTQDIKQCDWYFRVGAGPRACPHSFGNIIKMGNHRGLPLRNRLVDFHKSGFDNKEILYISVGAGLPCPKWNAREKEGAGTAPLRRTSHDVIECFG